MSIIASTEKKYQVTPDMIKKLIATDLGVNENQIDIRYTFKHGPGNDPIRNEPGPIALVAAEVTVK